MPTPTCKRYDGDPRFSKIPVSELISKDYAAQRAALIDPQTPTATSRPAPCPQATPPISPSSTDGNILSLIQSNYQAFGSGVTVRGMGFALQDRGALFNLDPQSPDSLAGRKRPFHTIIPGFMQHGDQHIGFGIMGGMNQPLAHAQFVSNFVDYHMNIQEALSTARFTVSHVPAHLSCNIVIESRVPTDVRDQLTHMGHIFDVRGAYSTAMGRGQAVLDDSSTHVHYGASSPRADGSAEPQPPPIP